MTRVLEVIGVRDAALAREVAQGLVLLALAGSVVGGLVGMVGIATRVLGR